MEKGGLRRLGKLFHKSESEDSEPDAGREATPSPSPSPCPSPSLQDRREHRLSGSSSHLSSGGERKKRSAFLWRLRKKQQHRKERPAEAETWSSYAGSAPASPSFSSRGFPSEPSTPTNSRSFDMPDTQYIPHGNQPPSPVPSQDSQFAFAIPMDAISTLPASFRKSKTHTSESSKEENKKKPVLGKFGNFFTTGRRKSPKNTLASFSPHDKSASSGSPQKIIAPLASIDIEDLKDLSKSEESLIDKICDYNRSKIQTSVEQTEELIYKRDLTPLYNNIVSEWNTKAVSSDSEWSSDWRSSSETIKNTLCDSNLTLQTLEAESELVTDTTKTTTPNFFKSLTNIPSEDLEHSILNHKHLVNVHSLTESEYATPKDQVSILESRPSERAHPSKVLTLDIFLRKTEQPDLTEPVTAVLDNDCSSAATMDKKSVVRRSGKRRKSQSSSDVPNGDRQTSEHIAKEEPVFDNISTDLASEKTNISERKVKASQQNNSPTANHDIRAGSNHRGVTKAESEKSKLQLPTSSPYRKKSLKKNQSETGHLSPTVLKTHGKDSSTKRQTEGTTDGYPISKCTSVETTSFGVNTIKTSEVISSPLSLSERKESNTLFPANSSDGSILLHADKRKNGQMTTKEKSAPDLDSARQRNISFDVSRSVTTKVSLPAKPKNIELNLKAPRTLENAENGQDTMDKTVKINFSIANKISMFENKQTNQNQSPEVSTSKKGSVSNTFVGRAKLRFGKQSIESEQTNKITNKSSGRQKPLQNGSRIKEVPTDLKTESEGITWSGVITSEDGRVAGTQLTQNGNVDDTWMNGLTFKKMDAELATDNLQPKPVSLLHHEDIETSQNSTNSINSRSISPESGEELCLNTEICSPRNHDKCLVQSGLLPRRLELEHNMMFQIQHEEKNTNTVLENIQVFEQNIGSQQNPGNGCHVPKAGNEDGICDSPSDMAKFTETLKNIDSSVCIPQKKKRPKDPKTPAPHFAMPPIHEDNLEKVYDPNIFTFGLGIKRNKPQDLAPSLQLKLQSIEAESRVRPKRASAENSILLQSLKSFNRSDPLLSQETILGKETKDITDGDIKRSRLENSSIFSSLLSPAVKEKGFMPSVTSVNTITTSFASQKSAKSSVMPPVGFDTLQKEFLSDFKAPDYMEKYLQTDDAKKERSLQIPNFGNLDTNFSGWLKTGQYEANVSPGYLDVEAFTGNNQNKINPRPGKLMICNKSDPSANHIEVFNDVLDCTSWDLSPVISVKVIRGCWILYQEPHFEGPSIPLEEGELELTNLWGEEQPSDNKDECKSPDPTVIGSIRHVVKDYRICRIDLFTEPEGRGVVNSYFDDIEEIRIIGNSQKTSSIQVHLGVWLIYEEPGFQGIPLMLEPGEYPNLSFWEKKEAYIRSLRPLKMGGRKVEFPESPKVIIYEKPFFEGSHIELDSELVALAEEGNKKEEPSELEPKPLTSIGSIKVIGGVWVAYEKPEFAGHQYLLEEGEYQEWVDWGGYDEQVQSLRPIRTSFTRPHMIMYADKDFGTKSSSINVLGIISNLKDTGYGLRTQSINVLSGVWVAYENPDFTGEQYILDKGMYPSYEIWGSRNCKISSVQPIVLDNNSDHMRKFKVQLFSEPAFQGKSKVFEKDSFQIQDLFTAKSSKVTGSWIVYDKKDFSGNQYVLEEGAYPDLCAMGCLSQICLKSLQFVNIELSEPVIALFEKENFKGKKIEFTSDVVNLQFLGYNTHVASIQVNGGIWVIYEYNNYRGRQILLSPKKIQNWFETSGYHGIGSLRPLLQKCVYFKLQNKETGMFMTTDANQDDLNLLRIHVAEDTKSDDQVWVYENGLIKSRVAEDFCLTMVGNLITPGAKLGLALEQNEEKQYWKIQPDGRIYSKMRPNLVLDIKGGKHYDQNHLIVNSVDEDKITQCWKPQVV